MVIIGQLGVTRIEWGNLSFNSRRKEIKSSDAMWRKRSWELSFFWLKYWGKIKRKAKKLGTKVIFRNLVPNTLKVKKTRNQMKSLETGSINMRPIVRNWLGVVHKWRHGREGGRVSRVFDNSTKASLIKSVTVGVGGQKCLKLRDVIYRRSLNR
jgi:hypothetical protein